MPKIKPLKFSILLCLFISFLITNFPAFAEQKIKRGNYQAHYSVFPSSAISAEVAALYQIKRSKNRALINITPQRISSLNNESNPTATLEHTNTQGIKAQVNGSARNLIGNTKDLQFREVVEGDVIYYLAEIRYNHEEHFRFDIKIKPLDKDAQTINLKFEKKFLNK